MYETRRLWIHKNRASYRSWLELLNENGLDEDVSVEYTVGLFDENRLIATASLQQNVIKCVSISKDYKGENLLSLLVTHLLRRLEDQSIRHVFLYTKPESASMFNSLGFSMITETKDVSFMEFGQPNLDDYLAKIASYGQVNAESSSSIVMNANPFTLGHQYLIELAASENDVVYVFIVSEDISEYSTDIRMNLVKQGTAHLPNVVVLPTDHYQVSIATFPSYFLKDKADLTLSKIQAELDANVFSHYIAPTLKINKRYVGKEPYSEVTAIYNQTMKDVFNGTIELIEYDRIQTSSEVISATKVRECVKNEEWETVEKMVPTSTYDYIKNMR